MFASLPNSRGICLRDTCGHGGAESLDNPVTIEGGDVEVVPAVCVAAAGQCHACTSKHRKACAADVNNAARSVLGMSGATSLFVIACFQERHSQDDWSSCGLKGPLEECTPGKP